MGEQERRVLHLAGRQQGVVARAQVLGEGMSARAIDGRRARGRWSSLLPGVYRIEGSPPGWWQQVTATALWAGERGVLSHRTAAAVWGLSRYREVGRIHVTVGVFLPAPSWVATHQSTLRPKDLVVHRGLRITSIPRTLLDLAKKDDPADVEAAADSALAKKLTTVPELRRFVNRHRGHRGIRLLRRLVEGYEGGNGPVESELESRVLELIDRAGLPRPRRQQRLSLGGQRRRLDFCFPGTNVVIEADGYASHASPTAFETDRARANALAVRGYVVLRWTWSGIRDRPQALLDELARALEAGARRAA